MKSERMGMNRRSNEVEGVVNFPMEFMETTNEGGMYVQLWVIDEQSTDEAYGVCTGTNFSSTVSECFMGSDISSVEERFFTDHEERYNEHSVPLLANILLGSTGWSSGDFIATFADLTAEGKQLYTQMQKIYPNATFALMTFLDT